MAQIFLSCSHDDPGSALQLAKDLKDLAHVVWLDRDLAGGQAWWDQFLARIWASDLFVFVLRLVALSSTACQWEYGYVVELQGPILPVLVLDGCSLNVLPPAHSRALQSLPVGVPLPDALAAPPEVPLFYLATLSQQLSQGLVQQEGSRQSMSPSACGGVSFGQTQFLIPWLWMSLVFHGHLWLFLWLSWFNLVNAARHLFGCSLMEVIRCLLSQWVVQRARKRLASLP